ncbi:MAG: hypothetical protein ACE5G2_10820 [Candidatus Krumholzibacteriia bacterium]
MIAVVRSLWVLCLLAVANPVLAQVLVMDGATNPSWSPDGSELVCQAVAGILRVPVSGAPVDTIVRNTASDEVGLPLWHPDGSHIVHVRRDAVTPGDWEIVLRDLEGGAPVAWPAPGLWDDPGMTLSPDGSEALYSDSGDQVWALNLSTGAVRFVLAGSSAALSPDGQWIAFATDSSENATLAIEPVAGGERVLLGPGFFPHWTPGSAFVVYSNDALDLVLANRDGTFGQILQTGSEWYISGPVSSAGKLAYTKCEGEWGTCAVWTLDLMLPTPVEQTTWGVVKSAYR